MIEISSEHKTKLFSYKYIDLFAGIGGFRLALDSFGATCVFTSEWDKHCQTVYKNNFNETPFVDITTIKEKNIPPHDIICAGFPWQAFSISGKQKGFEDTRGTLFFDIARIAKHHKPKLMILENVKNFARHNDGKTLGTVLSILNEINYHVEYKVLNASMFGVPQARKRIFLVCIRKDLKNIFEIPEKNNLNSNLEDVLIPDEEVNLKCYNDSFQIEEFVKKDSDILYDMFEKYPSKPIRIGTVKNGGQGERIYSTKGHGITLSAYGGGVFGKTGGYLINNRLRRLDPRECARLTGFPDEFILHENIHQNWKQFGNCVVVNIIQEILVSLIKKKII